MQHQAGYRSVTSRAYYAAFNVCSEILIKEGFPLPNAGSAHELIQRLLNNCGYPSLQSISNDLKNLMFSRKRADYDCNSPKFNSVKSTQTDLKIAEKIISVVEKTFSGPDKTDIVSAIHRYKAATKQ
jgi:uncharacterized protein (UPF0332 family)